MFQNITGNHNTASGANALFNSTTGNFNTALGYDTLRNSTGNQNVAIRFGAGSVLTSGNRNIYLGHSGAAIERLERQQHVTEHLQGELAELRSAWNRA